MPEARRLTFEDEPLGDVPTPRGPLRLVRGFGSGLARRRSDPPGVVWGVGDRGPNLSIRTAVERWGLEPLAALQDREGAKLMPRPDVGPALGRFVVDGDAVRLTAVVPLHAAGRALSGLPLAGASHAQSEPACDLAGALLPTDAGGADTEGLAALSDGGFWVGDEYGPSLLRVASDGRVLFRWIPAGCEGGLADSPFPARPVLPAIAAKRRLNRGFEGLALSMDERQLHLAFQSPLAHPDVDAHRRGRHVRIWTLEAGTGEILAQRLYPLDPPESFRRDREAGPFDGSDIKVSELAALAGNRLLVLERGSATTKLYVVTLTPETALAPEHLDAATRPTLEERDGAAALDLPVLHKTLLLSTDDLPALSPDLEGMVLLSPRELLLVNDNDFGVEGVSTAFWRVTLDADLA